VISFHLNDIETCRTFYELAFSKSRTAIAKAPERNDVRDAMAGSAGAMGDLNLSLGDAAAAAPYYAMSHDLVVGRAAQDPDNAGAQRELSFSHYRVATASLLMGEHDAARQHYEQCLELRRKLAESEQRNAHKQIDLMVALARCGQHADAAEVARKLGGRASEDPSVLFQIACGYSLCVPAVVHGKSEAEITAADRGQQDEYASKAVAAVREAIQKGYRDRVALERDPDLRPMQQRPEFKALLDSIKLDQN
jgi:hypothetical protein